MSTRWEVNITPAERVGRILLGLIGAVGGMLLLTGSPTPVAATLEVLLLLAGLDLVVTGASNPTIPLIHTAMTMVATPGITG